MNMRIPKIVYIDKTCRRKLIN